MVMNHTRRGELQCSWDEGALDYAPKAPHPGDFIASNQRDEREIKTAHASPPQKY